MNTFDQPDALNVSRETFDRLSEFEAILRKWNARINLVSDKSLNEFWTRHVVDSIQVYRIAPSGKKWVDLGSGGGFPGIVVAILTADEQPGTSVILVESDQRKSAFLRAASRDVGISCTVLPQRVENAPAQEANIISARALADLSTLLELSHRHLAQGGVALFPKGITWQKELDAARRGWHFDIDVIDSQTRPGAAILKIGGATRV